MSDNSIPYSRQWTEEEIKQLIREELKKAIPIVTTSIDESCRREPSIFWNCSVKLPRSIV